MGHSEHGSRRLGAALRLLKGPASMLNPMLKGLAVAELTALSPPDSSYEVVYDAIAGLPEPAKTTLSHELSGLKLRELRQRAKAAGMCAEQLESAMDADNPKQSLVSFLIEQQVGDALLRSELQELGLKALRRRAKDVGATAEQVLDAMDTDEPKNAVIELILATHGASISQASGATTEEQRVLTELDGAATRVEYEGPRVMVLVTAAATAAAAAAAAAAVAARAASRP
eukprot:COSAG02_NODE_4354_length_5460_cov_3.975191_3_plen_229_part_00